MDNLRLFVGIGLPENIIERLTLTLGRMKAELLFRKWTHPADLHITLHFLGDTRYDQLDALRAVMAGAAAATPPMRLALTAPGTFGPPHAPRILWLGVAERDMTGSGATESAVTSSVSSASIVTDKSGESGGSSGSGGLRHLHAALSPGLAAAGFALDERPFRPHLTLGRQGGAGCDEETIHAVWREAVAIAAENGESEPFSWIADRVTLFRSHLGRRPSYERLEEWQFTAL